MELSKVLVNGLMRGGVFGFNRLSTLRELPPPQKKIGPLNWEFTLLQLLPDFPSSENLRGSAVQIWLLWERSGGFCCLHNVCGIYRYSTQFEQTASHSCKHQVTLVSQRRHFCSLQDSSNSKLTCAHVLCFHSLASKDCQKRVLHHTGSHRNLPYIEPVQTTALSVQTGNSCPGFQIENFAVPGDAMKLNLGTCAWKMCTAEPLSFPGNNEPSYSLISVSSSDKAQMAFPFF